MKTIIKLSLSFFILFSTFIILSQLFPNSFIKPIFALCGVTEDCGGGCTYCSGDIPPVPADCSQGGCVEINSGGGGGVGETFYCRNTTSLAIKHYCQNNDLGSMGTPGGFNTCDNSNYWDQPNCAFMNDPCRLYGGGGACGGNTNQGQESSGSCGGDQNSGCYVTSGGPGGHCDWVHDPDGGGNCSYSVNLCATNITNENSCWGQVGDGGAQNCYWYCPSGFNLPPRGTLDCPASTIPVNQPANFTLHGSDTDSNLSSAGLYYSPTGYQSWGNINGSVSCSGAGCTTPQSWTPNATGTYYVAANFYDSAGAKCTGNPWGISSGWSACGDPNSYCTVNVVDPSVNGVCGPSNGSNFYSAPSSNLCSAGTASSVSGSGPWTWSCNGSYGGSNASCSANKSIDGSCSATHYNCSAGTSAPGSDTDSAWKWACNGSYGGSNAPCSENKLVGVCGTTHYNCNAGDLGWTASYSDQWQWWCNGSNVAHPGSGSGVGDVLCSEMKPVNGVCGATHYNCNAGTSASNGGNDSAWTWACNGSYGGTNASSCSQYKPPTCSISASPATVDYYSASTITWSSTNATGCSVSPNGWTGTSGSQSSGNLTAVNTTYNLSCPGLDGTTCTGQTTVTARPPPPPPITCTAQTNPASVTWNWTNSPDPLTTYFLQVNPNSSATNPDGSFVSANTFNGWRPASPWITSATPGVPYYGHVEAGGGGQSSTWGNTATCTVPAPSAPALSCGSFNSAGVYTPVTATWANGTNLQITRDYVPGTNPVPGGPADQYWIYNAAASSGIVVTPSAGKYMPPGHIIYGRTTYDSLTFSATSSVTCPVPTLSPASISGSLEQKSGNACYTASAPDHTFKINSISSTTSNPCVTSVCKADPGNSLPNPAATAYNCAITFDATACLNQDPPTWPVSPTISLTGATTGNSGYSFTGWTDPSGTCQTAPTNSIAVDAGSSTTKNLTFNFSGDKWLKTKDSSFNGSSTTSVSIPIFVNPFPGSNDTGSPFFTIGQAGNILRTDLTPNTAYSTPNNWHDASYPAVSLSMNPSAFLSYIKSRKEHQPISDLANINADGIYVWTGGTLTISDFTKFNLFNVVLVSSGEIIIDKEPFSPTKSLAIVANTITFTNSVHKAVGIFIANTVNTGNPANQGLQIVGNLIALQTLNNGRSWGDTSIPSIFVEFDSSKYTALFPYLSTASYQWNQIQ